MSFVAFPAKNPGTPPAPFNAFDRGEVVFYLVGTVGGEELPTPSAQLSVDKVTTTNACDRSYRNRRGRSSKCSKAPGHSDSCGWSRRTVVDTIEETARGWRGRRRVVVATRSYSWERYTRGAKAAARESAQWGDPQGNPLRVWSNLVTIADAASHGYRTPRGRTEARPGRRGVGVENNARGTVRGRSVVVADPAPSTPAPVAPSTPAPVASVDPEAPSGLAAIAAETAANARAIEAARTPTPSWVDSMSRAPDATREREAAIAARAALRAQNAAATPEPTPVVEEEERYRVVDLSDDSPNSEPEYDPETDPSVLRFRLLDLD